MPTQSTAQGVLFSSVFSRPLHATFDLPGASSEGGAVLLAAADQRLGLLDALATALGDPRDLARVAHTLPDLLRQRVFGLACGYADANDAARLAEDPVFQLLRDRADADGPLASQPTLSRWENRVDHRALRRAMRALAECVITRHARTRRRQRPRVITLDLDITDDPTHGTQQLAFFHGFYDTWCYLPLVAALQFDDEPDQHVVAALLRPGNVATLSGVRGLLAALLPRLRRAFPRTRLRVRLDGGFAHPALFAFLDRQARTDYVIGLPGNAVLAAAAAPLLAAAREETTTRGWSERTYGETQYQARSWARPRRVVIKGEVVCDPAGAKAAKDNPRYVVTTLRHAPQRLYEDIYCARGQSENRLKELLHDVALGRTSCSRFAANQCRVLLSVAAYVLLQTVRRASAGTTLAHAQVHTLRERLLKLSALVGASVRRLTLRLPVHAPWRQEWCAIARTLGAVPL